MDIFKKIYLAICLIVLCTLIIISGMHIANDSQKDLGGGASIWYPDGTNAVLVDETWGVKAAIFTATSNSTTATSTFPRLSITTGISLLGEYFENFTTYVRSLFTGGNSITITNGSIAVDDDFLLNTGDTATGD